MKIIEAIRANNLDPSEFEFTTRATTYAGDPTDRVSHLPTSAYLECTFPAAAVMVLGELVASA